MQSRKWREKKFEELCKSWPEHNETLLKTARSQQMSELIQVSFQRAVRCYYNTSRKQKKDNQLRHQSEFDHNLDVQVQCCFCKIVLINCNLISHFLFNCSTISVCFFLVLVNFSYTYEIDTYNELKSSNICPSRVHSYHYLACEMSVQKRCIHDCFASTSRNLISCFYFHFSTSYHNDVFILSSQFHNIFLCYQIICRC